MAQIDISCVTNFLIYKTAPQNKSKNKYRSIQKADFIVPFFKIKCNLYKKVRKQKVKL